MEQSRRWCRYCEAYTLHARSTFTFGWGCLLTVLTGCLFLPVWLLLALLGSLTGWRCQVCGAVGNPQYAPRPRPIGRAPWPSVARWPALGLSALWRGLVGFGRAIEGTLRSLRALERACWRSLVDTYTSLPEWAHPIVWGLGIAAPIVSMLYTVRLWLRSM
jgi:hypothetical protein